MKKLICMILAVALLIPLAACGGGSSSSSEIGVYMLEKGVFDDGATYTGAELKEDAVIYKIEITTPGTAIAYMEGERWTGEFVYGQETFYYNNNSFWYVEDGETEMLGSFHRNGNLITLSGDGATLYYRKK